MHITDRIIWPSLNIQITSHSPLLIIKHSGFSLHIKPQRNSATQGSSLSQSSYKDQFSRRSKDWKIRGPEGLWRIDCTIGIMNDEYCIIRHSGRQGRVLRSLMILSSANNNLILVQFIVKYYRHCGSTILQSEEEIGSMSKVGSGDMV